MSTTHYIGSFSVERVVNAGLHPFQIFGTVYWESIHLRSPSDYSTYNRKSEIRLFQSLRLCYKKYIFHWLTVKRELSSVTESFYYIYIRTRRTKFLKCLNRLFSPNLESVFSLVAEAPVVRQTLVVYSSKLAIT